MRPGHAAQTPAGRSSRPEAGRLRRRLRPRPPARGTAPAWAKARRAAAPAELRKSLKATSSASANGCDDIRHRVSGDVCANVRHCPGNGGRHLWQDQAGRRGEDSLASGDARPAPASLPRQAPRSRDVARNDFLVLQASRYVSGNFGRRCAAFWPSGPSCAQSQDRRLSGSARNRLRRLPALVRLRPCAPAERPSGNGWSRQRGYLPSGISITGWLSIAFLTTHPRPN